MKKLILWTNLITIALVSSNDALAAFGCDSNLIPGSVVYSKRYEKTDFKDGTSKIENYKRTLKYSKHPENACWRIETETTDRPGWENWVSTRELMAWLETSKKFVNVVLDQCETADPWMYRSYVWMWINKNDSVTSKKVKINLASKQIDGCEYEHIFRNSKGGSMSMKYVFADIPGGIAFRHLGHKGLVEEGDSEAIETVTDVVSESP